MKKLLAVLGVLTLVFALAACGGKGGGGNKNLSMLTGGTGGTYYPLGGQIANLINKKADLNVTAQSSGASVENMQALQKGDAQIAFTQTDIANYAVQGKLMFKDKKVDNVKAIGTLYPETIQIVALDGKGIETVDDLKGKTVSVGAPGSGTEANAEQILAAFGLTFDDIKAKHLAFDESTSGIQDGNIDAAFITSGAPTGAVESLSAQKKVTIVPIPADTVKKLQEKYPYYSEDTVKKGTYGLESDVPTAAVKAMLVVTDDLDKDTVYNITKALFDNVDSIENPKKEYISAKNALDGVGIDIHPGAKKYFDEKGVSK